jgi:hypothetical protein
MNRICASNLVEEYLKNETAIAASKNAGRCEPHFMMHSNVLAIAPSHRAAEKLRVEMFIHEECRPDAEPCLMRHQVLKNTTKS